MAQAKTNTKQSTSRAKTSGTTTTKRATRAKGQEATVEETKAAAPQEPETMEQQPVSTDEQAGFMEDGLSSTLGKYADRHVKTREADPETDCDPRWRYRDSLFVAGRQPARLENVFGRMYGILHEAGPEGLTGKELVSKLRRYPNIAPRSKYAADGLPPIGWAEDYVNGGLRKNGGVVKFHKNQPKKPEEQEAEAAKPEAKASDGTEQVTLEQAKEEEKASK